LNNAERFLNAYAAIERELQKILDLKEHRRFYVMVDQAARVNPMIKRYRFDLREYADLRNAIVHDRAGGKIIATPNDDVVESIEAIASTLLKPPKVVPLFQKEVLTLTADDTVSQAIRCLSLHGYSQAPIMERGSIYGLITSNMIVRWMGAGLAEGTFDLNETTVGEILSHAKDGNDYSIISSSTCLFDIPELFLRFQEKGSKLEAAIITRQGDDKGPIIGIITHRDLPLVQRELSGRVGRRYLV